ncbi:MAG: hypothetical protein Q8R28_05645, partial [Dehalococcoidia bacterium]|nr:hypothetical protein [Dehalococcoidia bacterium]
MIALLAAFLRGSGRGGLFPFLRWGAFVSVVLSAVLTYGVVSGWDREAAELPVNGLAAFSAMALMAWLGWTCRQVSGPAADSAGILSRLSVLLGATVLLVVPGLDMGLKQARALGVTGNDLATRLGAVILALTIAGLVGVTLYRATAQIRRGPLVLATMLVLFVLLVRD